MRILTLVLFVGLTAYGWDRGKAMAFLESRQTQWAAWKPAQKSGGACLSCHTGLSYLLAGRVLGEGEQGRKLVAGVRHRLRATPVEATLPDPGAEAVLNLFALAMFRKSAGDPVGEAERGALTDLWARQVWDGKDKGSWTWVNAALHPMDSELSHYWGTAVAERALAAFPEGPADRVAAMRGYLRRESGNQPLHHRLAWAAFGERSAGAGVLRDLWAAQGKDGGWSTAALGPWSAQGGCAGGRGIECVCDGVGGLCGERGGGAVFGQEVGAGVGLAGGAAGESDGGVAGGFHEQGVSGGVDAGGVPDGRGNGFCGRCPGSLRCGEARVMERSRC